MLPHYRPVRALTVSYQSKVKVNDACKQTNKEFRILLVIYSTAISVKSMCDSNCWSETVEVVKSSGFGPVGAPNHCTV